MADISDAIYNMINTTPGPGSTDHFRYTGDLPSARYRVDMHYGRVIIQICVENRDLVRIRLRDVSLRYRPMSEFDTLSDYEYLTDAAIRYVDRDGRPGDDDEYLNRIATTIEGAYMKANDMIYNIEKKSKWDERVERMKA